MEALKEALGEQFDTFSALISDYNDAHPGQEITFSGDAGHEVQELRQELACAKFDGALEVALMKSGAKNTKAVRALLDTESLELKDGVLSGFSEQIAKVRSQNGYLFDSPVRATALSQGEPAMREDPFISAAKKAAGV